MDELFSQQQLISEPVTFLLPEFFADNDFFLAICRPEDDHPS